MFECPSHSDTFRRSFVACRMVRARVCLRTCGETRLADNVGQRVLSRYEHAYVGCIRIRRGSSHPCGHSETTPERGLHLGQTTTPGPRMPFLSTAAGNVLFGLCRGSRRWLVVEESCPRFEGPPTPKPAFHRRNKDGAWLGHGCRPDESGRGHPGSIASPGP